MDLSEDMCNSLVKWLETLDLRAPEEKFQDLSDGVIMAQALLQIAPDYFLRLNTIINADIGTNCRLKINNLKKVIKCLEEYYQDVLNLHLLDIAKPNLPKIGELQDKIEIGKILRLILGCAVNCDAKQEYITRIMALDASIQQNIMQAIQQLEEVTHGRGRSSLSLLGLESDARFQRLISDLDAASEMKDMLSQKCYNLETQIVGLTEEKSSLAAENKKLLDELKELKSLYGREEPPSGGLARNTEMRKQLELLKDDLFKTETQRDDYRLKVLELEKDIQILQEKNIELQCAADKAAQLKDEVDALTETAEKAKILEISITSYKKKLEEFADLKKKYKSLQDENNEMYQQNIKNEEEIKRNNVYKSQSELYKKQVAELHQKIEEEIRKSDKLNFENKKIESKLSMIQREKESLIEERDGLKEMNEELRCQQQQSQNPDGQTAVASELAPTELQARLKYLEKENQNLRVNAEESAAIQLQLDDVQHRLEKSLEQYRTSNHRILELEAQLEEMTKGLSGTSTNSSTTEQHDELLLYKNKCATLQNALANKENEIQLNEERYKKSLEKARDVIKQLDPVVGTSHTDRGEQHHHSVKRSADNLMRSDEEKLLAASFYKLAVICQREAIDERFAVLTQGQSFLSRQRQSTPRKSMQPYRSK